MEEKRTMDTVGRFVRDLGFPIVVACYLLFRLDGQVQAMQMTLNNILHAVQK